MNDITKEEIRASVVPKSDQLNADDLLTGPITVTVQSVKAGDKEQPIVIGIDGGRQPYKPCKGMRRILVQAWTDEGKSWVGKRMTLYRNPDVKYGGVKVGGIQISHLSDLPAAQVTYALTVSRGYKIEYVVNRLESSKPDSDDERIVKATIAVIRDAILNDNQDGLRKIVAGIEAKYKVAIAKGLSQQELAAVKSVTVKESVEG